MRTSKIGTMDGWDDGNRSPFIPVSFLDSLEVFVVDKISFFLIGLLPARFEENLGVVSHSEFLVRILN